MKIYLSIALAALFASSAGAQFPINSQITDAVVTPVNSQITDAVATPVNPQITDAVATPVNSQITDVTVFLRGAQVTRQAMVSLDKGSNEIILRGLATGIDPNSIQVAAPQDVLINSVVHEVNFLQGLPQSKRVIQLQDSMVTMRDLMNQNQAEQNLLEQEKQMLLANQRLAGEETGVDVAELEKAANFLRGRMTDIETKKLGLQKKMVEYTRRNDRMKQQVQELNVLLGQPSNDIRIKLDANAGKQIELRVRYLVANATWVPGYDVRAKDTQSPIRLDYRADVFQQTGEDWKNINLTLSTGNPSLGGTPPALSAWHLYASDPYAYNRRKGTGPSGGAYTLSAPPATASEYYSADKKAEEAQEQPSFEASVTLANYTEVQVGATTAEFVINVKQSVLSGDKPEQVSIQSAELSADFRHFAVPKLDKDAFLTAGITGWEALNLLPGNARIFFEGTYVTEAYIDPALTEDTLALSLGRDRKVVIQRECLKDFHKARFIGLNREKTIAWEYKIRNTKPGVVHLILEDQIPVSQDKDITVKVEDISGAKLDDATGKLVWDMTLQPGESKTVRLIYSVKHPKNKVVPGI